MRWRMRTNRECTHGYPLPGGKQRREPVDGEELNAYSIESAREVHSKRVVKKNENRIIRLRADDTKDREARDIPCQKLYGILKAIPRALHDPHVFLFKGKPASDIRTALRKAYKEAGTE